VIAAAVTRFLNFEFSRSTDGSLHFRNSDTGNVFSRKFDINGTDEFFKFLSQIAWRLRDKIAPVSVHTYGDLPIGAGLSSSAACSIGFSRGLDHLFGAVNRVVVRTAEGEDRANGPSCCFVDEHAKCDFDVDSSISAHRGDHHEFHRISTRHLHLGHRLWHERGQWQNSRGEDKDDQAGKSVGGLHGLYIIARSENFVTF
jgi:hypothetical protein